jgi:hypothetical protein
MHRALHRFREEFNFRHNAYRLALGSKRLDLCCAQFAHSLHLAGKYSLQGKVCLELGAGRVLSHAIVCHLLSAKKVFAIDLHPIARPEALATAIAHSVPSIVRDTLAPFADHAEIRSRLDALLAIRRFDLNVLARLGIEYSSPIDVARGPFGQAVDFIYSWSVLQHVPSVDIPSLLRHLDADLRPDGRMLHNVHLEDIGHSADAPFAFLAQTSVPFTPAQESTRGNRLRRSAWQAQFEALQECKTRTLYAWQRRDKDLPSAIDPLISHTGIDDLRTSHLGIWVEKIPGPGQRQ